MEKQINLDEILKSYLTLEAMRANNSDYTYNMVLAAMKEACRQTLELAVENAEMTLLIDEENDIVQEATIDKESILNTIKQVEL
jgi:hypothetical protein